MKHMYAVINPNNGMFVGIVEAVDAVLAVKHMWNEYGTDTGYELYLRVNDQAYAHAAAELQITNPHANATPRT